MLEKLKQYAAMPGLWRFLVYALGLVGVTLSPQEATVLAGGIVALAEVVSLVVKKVVDYRKAKATA